MSDLLWFLALVVLIPVAVTIVLRLRYRRWSMLRVTVFAALPVPMVVLGLAAFLFGEAVIASPEQCGVDACGMAAAAAYYIAIGAVIGIVFGAILSLGLQWLIGMAWRPDRSRPERRRLDDVFD